MTPEDMVRLRIVPPATRAVAEPVSPWPWCRAAIVALAVGLPLAWAVDDFRARAVEALFPTYYYLPEEPR